MPSRRDFLRTSAGAGWMLSLGTPAILDRLAPKSRAESEVNPDLVRFTPEVEPIVRLIEDTPREKCFAMMVEQLDRGLPYRTFLAALFLAGIRNVNPQPPGFKFHCVFAIHAANQLSLDAVPEDRLLPLFWALDQFKRSQADDVRQGDFKLTQVRGTIPPPEKAFAEFTQAMDAWDQERAGRAVTSLTRNFGSHEVIEAFWRYGARDFRNIGHKAIFVANAWRTLETIGWQHAEPTLRSIVLGVLDFGKSRQVDGYDFESQAYLANSELAKKSLPKLPANWTGAAIEPAATKELLDTIRGGSIADSSKKAIELLQAGKSQAQGIWDAVHLAAGELMMRQPGIYGIHTVTSANALRYAFRTASDQETRLVLMLQGIGWMCQFRNFMAARPQKLGSASITELAPADMKKPMTAVAGAAAAFELVGKDASTAAARAAAFAQAHPHSTEYARLARQLIFRKGTDAHHYKYAASIFEDADLVSPMWKPQMLATSVYYLRGSQEPDAPVMTQALAALKRA